MVLIFRRLVLLLLVLLTFFTLFGEAAEVEREVYDELQEDSSVSVIVMMKDDSVASRGRDLGVLSEESQEKREDVIRSLEERKKGVYEFRVAREFERTNGFAAEVDAAALQALRDDSRVEKIYENRILHPTLTTSVPQIHANIVHNLSVGGFNITGAGQTVCIIDTGIDTDHSAFTSRILSQYCYCSVTNFGSGGCCSNNQSESNSAEDDQGHGTHVAGIAVGNYNTHRGVAKGANIVSVKVCNNATSASCATSDVISGIERCTSNVSAFNISVISISLGGGGPYNSYCPTDSIAASINSAYAANISVVIAAGNNGFTTGISSPGCVENATAVGAVTSADVIQYNRGNILSLLAPGVSITSPYVGGGTTSLSGTSMSTPHVSGSIALLRQYWRLAYNITPTVDYIENKLKYTGVIVGDVGGSGNTYARIDIERAIQPFLNFTANNPINATNSSSSSFIINMTSDVNLTRGLLEWNYSNGTVRNLTMTQNNASNFFFNITSLTTTNYTYKVFGNDSMNTYGYSNPRFLNIFQNPPVIAFNRPSNNSYHNGSIRLNVTISATIIGGSNYNVTNSSNRVVQTASNSSVSAASFFWNDVVNFSNSTFPEGNYSIIVFANDSLGNQVNSIVNLTVDKIVPAIFAVNRTKDPLYNNATVVFYVNVTDAHVNTSAVFLQSNFSGSAVNYTMTLESGNLYNYTLFGSGNLSNQGNVSYVFHTIDLAGNVNLSLTFSFVVQNRNLSLVNITLPANGSVLEVGNATTFNLTATDPDNDTLTYLWLFGDGRNSTSQTPSKQYNSTGTFVVVVNATDYLGASLNTNITIIVNDTVAPTTSSITYKTSHHIGRDGVNYSVNASFFDYSGIFNASLKFNGSMRSTSCLDINTTWNCSWGWQNLSAGDYNFMVNVTDNFSTKHLNSTTYTFSILSCSDSSKNGDETGTDCGGSCSACAVSGSSGSSAGGGGGGGGGGGSTPKASTGAVVTAPEEVPTTGGVVEAQPSVGKEGAVEETAAVKGDEEVKGEGKRALVGRAIGQFIKKAATDYPALWVGVVLVTVLVTLILYMRRREKLRDQF